MMVSNVKVYAAASGTKARSSDATPGSTQMEEGDVRAMRRACSGTYPRLGAIPNLRTLDRVARNGSRAAAG